MEQGQVTGFKEWFSTYCRSFATENRDDQKNLTLKEEHTYNVCANSSAITRSLGLDLNRARLAEVVALFHDVGRFPQYRRYRTFRDSISINHAALGAGVLTENNVLDKLTAGERSLILEAVTLHNVFALPGNLDPDTLLQVRIIRDADKLDIWRVFADYYAQKDGDRPSAVALGLPDTGDYSHQVIASVQRREMVHLADLRTLNDFRMLQIAWIFDLNFKRSLELVLERALIDSIAEQLPRKPEITSAVDAVRFYVEERLSAG